MAHDARSKSVRQLIPPQTLLVQALKGLIRAAARQLDPAVLQEMVRSIGAQLGRQALLEYCVARDSAKRLDGYTWAECLKEIGAQFGWALRVAVESEGVIRVTVLSCDIAASGEAESYLCEFGSGLFGGAMAEAIGDVKVSASECSETAPRNCRFAIYYRESKESQAAQGVVYSRLTDRPVRRAQERMDSGLGARLTPRETQVLRHIAQGLSDRKIAAALRLSVRTVENHAARIRRKLRVGNRAALVRFALRSDLVDP